MNTKNTEEGEEEENCYMKFGNERDLLHFRTSRTGGTFGTCGTNGTYGTCGTNGTYGTITFLYIKIVRK